MRTVLFDKEISDNYEVRRVLAVQVGPTDFEITRFNRMRSATGIEEYGDPSGVSIIDGVARWKSNDQIPPKDAVQYYGIDQLPGFNQAKTDATRDSDTKAFFVEYRKHMANHKHTGEEISEMVAAFGPGEVVVNAFTGKRTKLPGRKS